ncbi:plastocyanin/azurin family copper-binding protein [Salinarchaeum laminariae]|uniref:plastocyanin/azurin family copper-binding protein n=1 Tax=Salinarchaeum laminariae TaxID=869888 RepID=UPI0020BECBF6|nr:plastocyanin/azurin family copper-binding protein [Salinarchaeum laminariae]
MKRRDFLRTAGGAAGAAAATSATASAAAAEGGVGAIQDDGNTTGPGGNDSSTGGNGTTTDGNQSDGGGNQSDAGGGSGGGTQEIIVGPEGDMFTFSPSNVTIAPGTTVTFTWETDGHNVVPQSQPEGANWEGYPDVSGTGTTYEHTFETIGTYEYLCEPHAPGMAGTIEVAEGGGGGGGGGYEPPDPAHMGIPVQKHFVGALAFMGIFMTLVFTFYLLKYGESAHTAAPNKKD